MIVMSIRAWTVLLAAGLLGFVGGPARTADTDASLADEVLLKSVSLGTDGPALLEFFRQRSQVQAPKEKLAEWIKQLGDKEPAKRAKAAANLIATGPAAIPLLRQAVKDPDEGEVVALARRCLRALEGETSSGIPAAAARLLAQRRPDGAVEVLLAYLPFADNDEVVDEVKSALGTMAYRDGKPAPSLLKALGDESSLRRAVAIDALCAAGPAEPRATLIKLLDDKKPIVRLRAGLALANAKEEKAIDKLIPLLGELPPAYGARVEEFLVGLAGEETVKAKLTNAPGAREKCRDAWAAWWKESADLEKLVGEVRKRTLKDVEQSKVLELIKKMGDDDFDIRQKAYDDLLAMGPAVLHFLKKSKDDADVEIRDRSKRLIAQIEKEKGAPLSPVTARLIALRKPKGAAEALLAFLPFAEESNQDEVQAALNFLAYRDGKPDPAVLKGLEDKSVIRRIAAAEALCRPGTAYPQAAVRKLLKDTEPGVRLRVALALAAVHDKEAVPVVIACLTDLSAEESQPAEDLLQRLAQGGGPKEEAGSGDDARKKRRDAWAAWWKENGAKVDMAVLKKAPAREPYLGYTLIVLNGNGQIFELDAKGKERWRINGLNNVFDAEVLPNGRVLVAEYNANLVTERTLKGDVVWKHSVNWPIGVQRLRNGNTFIITRQGLHEVTRAGKEVFHLNRQNFNDIMAARKLPNGQMVVVSSNNKCYRFDATGKEIGSFDLINHGQTYGMHIRANGNVVLPQMFAGKVVEIGKDGKIIRELNQQQQTNSAYGAANGNIVTAQWTGQTRIVEWDKAGKVLNEHNVQGYAIRVKKR
jgi:HEAT repeat protein